MQTITFTCETITPMFLSGADGSTPELRPPSIKGALRFWWRAMNGHLDLKTLKAQEDEIFGSTEMKSKLLISIVENWKCAENEYLKPNYFNGSYLFFPLSMLPDRRAIPTGKTFKIELSSKDSNVLKEGICAFWLLSFLGGIGFRARRGGGNIAVEPTKGNLELVRELGISFKLVNNETVQTFMGRNLESCRRFIVGNNTERTTSDYSNLINSKIVTSNSVSNLTQIEKLYKEFRSQRKGDANLMLKAAFGLPLNSKMPNPPKRQPADHTEIKIQGEGDRRSSPIILRMIKFNNSLYWLVLRLNGLFLDKNISLIRSQSKEEVLPPQEVDDSLIDDFLNELIENENLEIAL